MPDAKKLLIVILNYKVTALTIDCLRSLSPEVAATPGVRVAVLENGTGEADYHTLRQAIADNGWGEWVSLSRVMPNRGFCGGNNVILREALAAPEPPEYIQLLNADTIVKPGALSALTAFMDAHPKVGIAGSRLLSPDGSDQAPAFRFPRILGEFAGPLGFGPVSRLLHRSTMVFPHPGRSVKVEWVPGASMILRTRMLQQIGILDEDLYTYFDDIDLCWRARAAGWETWYVHDSVVIHLEGASTGIHHARPKRRADYWFEARRRCFLNNFGPVRTALIDMTFIVAWSLRRLRRRFQPGPDLDPPHFLSDFIRHSVLTTGFKIRPVRNPALISQET